MPWIGNRGDPGQINLPAVLFQHEPAANAQNYLQNQTDGEPLIGSSRQNA